MDQFNEAKGRLSTLKKDPGNDVKLKIYALFKQVSLLGCLLVKMLSLSDCGKVLTKQRSLKSA